MPRSRTSGFCRWPCSPPSRRATSSQASLARAEFPRGSHWRPNRPWRAEGWDAGTVHSRTGSPSTPGAGEGGGGLKVQQKRKRKGKKGKPKRTTRGNGREEAVCAFCKLSSAVRASEVVLRPSARNPERGPGPGPSHLLVSTLFEGRARASVSPCPQLLSRPPQPGAVPESNARAWVSQQGVAGFRAGRKKKPRPGGG